MFKAAKSAVSDAIQARNPDCTELPLIPPSSLPASYSLSQLTVNIANTDGLANEEGKLRSILMLRSCLENSKRLPEEGDDASIEQLSLGLSKYILPDSSILTPENDSSTASSSADDLFIARQKGVTGLLALQSLLKLHSHVPTPIDPQILLSLIAFTSSRDPWTAPLSLSTSISLLSNYSQQTHTKTFIIDYVLQQFIRPIFSNSKPEAVTASGRKAMPSSAPRRRFDAKDLDEKSKPWMYGLPYAITVFEWVVANSSVEIATSNFPLYIPPLLTLLDSTNIPIRSRALTILSTFTPLLTPTLLVQTGLSEVFEDAITPTLMFLPNLTPVDESVQLLRPAYGALIVLGSILFSSEGKDEKGQVGRKYKETKFWDRIIRKGVLMGYAHASEHPAIVEVLLQNLNTIVSKMGIDAVKHLKDIVPVLATTLTDPFAPSHPSLLLAAIQALTSTILNCWPRMVEERYRVEIISALILCWTNISRIEELASLEAEKVKVKKELTVAGTMLTKAVEGDGEVDIRKELESVFAVDDGLRVVFGMGDFGD